MKKIIIILLFISISLSIYAKEKIRKVNKTIFTAGYLHDIKYRGYQSTADYTFNNKYTLGISFSHAYSKIYAPDYLKGKINKSDSIQYNVVKIVDIMAGKNIKISQEDNCILNVKAGLSYSNFQGKINFLPFNCNLIYDTEITNALGVALNAALHLHTKHKLGIYTSFYTNLNPERILLSLGIGIRFGKMTN